MNYADIVSELTLWEKAVFCSGSDLRHLQSLEKLGLPKITVTDGLHGLKKQKDKKNKNGTTCSDPAVYFPAASAVACSWDPGLIEKMGQTLGEECLEEKVSVLSGPGVNIKRSPLCGKNFDYFSEDPYLAGEMAAAFIKGVQSRGIGTALKYFAANNRETRKMTSDAVVDERTLREIYLAPFETAVKKARPMAIMTACNRLNGDYCSENGYLLNDILRKEWGFEGLVMTDRGACNDKIKGLQAGQDLEMPPPGDISAKKIVTAVENKTLDEAVLDEAVDRIITLIMRASENFRDYRYDKEEHHALARKIASESIVLLKNNENILPVDKTKTVAIIGEMAKKPRYRGSAGSLPDPARLENAFDEITKKGVNVIYAEGYSKKTDETDGKLIKEAVEAAKKADVAVIFAGLTEKYESEWLDRPHMDMPKSHNALIEAVASVCENVAVVLAGGAPVAMPWLGSVKAVLNSHIGGQAGGGAVADILFGDINPSGKLAETYPAALGDNPSYNNFSGSHSVQYREGIFVGYRYYDTANIPVLFPFGHGLSYTTFEYSDIKLSAEKMTDNETLTVTFRIKNTGKTTGAETAQLYVKDIGSTVYRPEKELKGFEKVYLEPGEEKEVTIELGRRAFAFFNVNTKDWSVESGDFEIAIGASVADIRLRANVNITSEDTDFRDDRKAAPLYYTADIMNVPDDQFTTIYGRELPPAVRDPSEPFDMNNCLEDAQSTKAGKHICRLVKNIVGMMSDDDANKSMAETMALRIPIRCMVSISMGVFSEKAASGLLDILNGKGTLKGMGKILSCMGNALKNIKQLFD